MKINWKVRLKNKNFWFAMIPALLLLAQQLASVFGYELPVAGLEEKLLSITSTVFLILITLGIVEDHTTAGISDSKRVMNYSEPRDDNKYL